MLCGPIAASRATGGRVAVETLVARIRYLRETRGRRISLRGGTSSWDLEQALALEGWRLRRVFTNRRVRLKDLARRIRRGGWVFRQNGHFFGVESARALREAARSHPTAMIVAGYRIHPKRGNV